MTKKTKNLTKKILKTDENNDTRTIASFDSLGLPNFLRKAINDLGYETPSPIQCAAIPPLLAGQDVLGEAQTGTGKTAAFALPVLAKIDTNQRHPQALILVPTRELAIQVSESFQHYAKYMEDFYILPVYGGTDISSQIRQLRRGVHVVIGTPGRIMDHLKRNSLSLNNLSTLVLDEADEMLNMGFLEDVQWIVSHAPEDTQRALFSATMPNALRAIVEQYLNEPVKVKIKHNETQVAQITKRFAIVPKFKKLDVLLNFLEIEFEKHNAIIIFTRTKLGSTEVADKLAARGFRAAAINGDMAQEARERVIKKLKAEEIDIVVATEVAARGLDLERLTLVVNYDIPYDPESFIHRIGRTGRAGRQGDSLLLVEPKEKRMLRLFEKALKGSLIEVFPPAKHVIQEKRISKFIKDLESIAQKEILPESFSLEQTVTDAIYKQLNVQPEQLSLILLRFLQNTGNLHLAPEKEEPTKENVTKQRTYRDNADSNKVVYKMQIGKQENLTAKDIVGALTNEVGIAYDDIGKISIMSQYTAIELAVSPDPTQQKRLENLHIKGHHAEASLSRSHPTQGDRQKNRKSSAAPRHKPSTKKYRKHD